MLARQSLLDDLALGSDSLTRDAHPCMLEGLWGAGGQSGSRARCVVVAIGVDSGATKGRQAKAVAAAGAKL